MKKNIKNGFTLIELLVTIFIIGVVLTISIVSFIGYVNKAKDKKILISKTNILSSAQNYVKEYYNSTDWFNIVNEGYETSLEYSCVSIEQLIGSGYLDKNINKDTVDDENYTFIILKRDINSKTINYKGFATGNDELICNKKFIIKPSLISKKTYTDYITAEYKISSDIIEDDDYLRKLEVVSISLGEKLGENLLDEPYEKFYTIVDFNNDDHNDHIYSKLIFNFDDLKYEDEENNIVDGKYDLQVILKDIGTNKEVEINDTFYLKKLNAPVINVEDVNKWRENKKINISYDNTNIKDGNDIKYFSFTKNINNFSFDDNDDELFEFDDALNEWKTIDDSNFQLKTGFEYKLNTLNSTIEFDVIENETDITATISDGTNYKVATKKIEKIDNHKYECRIFGDWDYSKNSADLSLKVYDKTSSSYISDKNIVKKFKWLNKSYKDFTGNSETISSLNVTKFGEYNASVKLRTGMEITCEKTIQDSSAPDINIEIYEDSEMTKLINIEDSKWYAGTYYVKVYTTDDPIDITDDDNKIFVCTTTSNNNCTLVNKNSNNTTIVLEDTGKHKIIAQAKKASNDTTSIVKTEEVWLDNNNPSIPTFKIYKLDDLTKDITDTYKPGENTWHNYGIRWTDFSATDSHSGIDHYEYKTNCAGNVKKLGASYDYKSKNHYYCIRSVDKLGHVSDWTGPYYFRIDTTKPKITVNAYKRSSSGKEEGGVVASLTDVTSGTINNYTNNVNGWLNKSNYPHGVYYKLSFSDDNSLTSYTVKFNTKEVPKSNSKVDTYGSTSTVGLSGSSNTGSVQIESEGYRKAVLKVYDQAGNYSTINLIAPLDRTPPVFTFAEDGCNKDDSNFSKFLNNSLYPNKTDQNGNNRNQNKILILENRSNVEADVDTHNYCSYNDPPSGNDCFRILTNGDYKSSYRLLIRVIAIDEYSLMNYLDLKISGKTIVNSDWGEDLKDCNKKRKCSQFRNILGKTVATIQYKGVDLAGNATLTDEIILEKTTTMDASTTASACKF